MNTSKDMSLNLSSFFYSINLWKIPEMSSGMEECKIPAWVRDKMLPSLERLVRRSPVRVAESCIRSCYSVLAIF